VKSSKHAFWQALIFTVVVFIIGLIFGVFLESSRADKVQLELMDSEITILDDQLRNRIIAEFDVNCDLARESTFAFADRIYKEAEQLERYSGATYFGVGAIDSLHRRYDLLRALLWAESVELKERCGEFHTVVYLYEFDTDNLDVDSQQLYYSRLLFDLKEKYANEVILIPLAADTGLDSVELILAQNAIHQLPAIMVDERIVLTDIITLEELEEIVFGAEA